MISTFFESVADRLADRWASMSAPALIFWLGGFLAWTRGNGGIHSAAAQFTAHPASTQAAAVLIALLVVATSGLVVQRLTAPFLRILEGYWPGWDWLTGLRDRRIRKVAANAGEERVKWDALVRVVKGDSGVAPTHQQLREFAELDRRQLRRPQIPLYYMPTRLGNILRAGETAPLYKYGLDAVTVWPRLWLVLPDTARQELQGTRRSLDTAAGATIWGLLFCAFAPWTWFAIPAGLGVAALALLLWIPARAQIFSDLLEATFDLYRTALYQHLRWPFPGNPQQERAEGQRLTLYLQRGSTDASPSFTAPP